MYAKSLMLFVSVGILMQTCTSKNIFAKTDQEYIEELKKKYDLDNNPSNICLMSEELSSHLHLTQAGKLWLEYLELLYEESQKAYIEFQDFHPQYGLTNKQKKLILFRANEVSLHAKKLAKGLHNFRSEQDEHNHRIKIECLKAGIFFTSGAVIGFMASYFKK